MNRHGPARQKLRCVVTSLEELRAGAQRPDGRRRRPARRWSARLAAALIMASTLLFVRVQVAAAATGTRLGMATAQPVIEVGSSQTPGGLAWIDLKDSRGISVWNYEMSLDRGGVTSPLKSFWSSWVDAVWGIYRAIVVIALWFLDWVLSFNWLSVVASPMLRTGDAMQSVVDRVGAVPTLLTVAAVAAVLWWMRGRWATGIWELGMALVISALATGVFAQPVHLLAGDNGLVMKSQQTGLELSALLNTGPGGGTDIPGADGMTGSAASQASGLDSVQRLRTQMTGSLVDTFVRQPTEITNFGHVLDGTKCEATYTAVVKAGPYGNDSDIRDKVGDCDKVAAESASNPSAAMATTSLLLIPAASAILLLAVVLAGSVIASACYALYLGVKLIIMLVLGLVPGGTRGGLFLTFAETAVSLLIIVFTSVFLGTYLQVIQELFAAGGAAGDAPAKTFLIVDILLVVGVIIFWRQRKRLRDSSRRLAEWMAQRPGKRREVGATRLPERSGIGLGAAAGTTLAAASQVAMIRQRRAYKKRPAGVTYNIGDARTQTVGVFGMWPDGGEPGAAGAPAGPGGPGGGAGGGAGKQLLALGAHAVLAGATGGTSAAASKALTASRSASRARLLARMGTAAAGRAPSSAVALGPRGAAGVPPRPGSSSSRPPRPRSAAGGPAARPTQAPRSTRPPAAQPGPPRAGQPIQTVRPKPPPAAAGPSRMRGTNDDGARYVKVIKNGQILWVRQVPPAG